MLAHIKNLIAIVGFAMTILSPVISLFFLKREDASEFQAWASSAVLFAGLIGIILSGKLTFSSEKKRMKELYSRDYKMFLDVDSNAFEMIKGLFHSSREMKQEEKTKVEFTYQVLCGITWKEYMKKLNEYHTDSSSPRIKLAEEVSIYHFS